MYKIITNGERIDVPYLPSFKTDLNFGSQIYEGTQLIGTVKKEDLISISFDIFEISITRNIRLLYDEIESFAIYTNLKSYSIW